MSWIVLSVFLPLLFLADPPDADAERLAQLAPNASDQADDRITSRAGGRFDVRFREAALFDALELLGEQANKNIVLESGVSGMVSLALRQVTFEEALLAILHANGLDYEERHGIVYVFAKSADRESAKPGEREVRVFKLKYVTALSAEEFLKPLLDETCVITRTGEVKEGIESDKESAGGFASAGRELIVIIAPRERMELIATALAEYDARPPQVLVEATIMRATLNEQNALGIDFNTLVGVNLQIMNAQSPALTDLTVGPLPIDRLDDFSGTARTDFNDAVPGGGLTIGIVKDQVGGFIRALEQITDVTILANPKMLTLNKQRGEVIVGRRDGYLTTTVTETAAIQTVEYLETGTKLVFRPFVTGNREVRMEIHPEDSNGGLTAANLPFQETTEATSNILLKDGHTILIGGLFRERSTASKSQVPGVGNIPVVGHLFGVQQDQTIREEVMILLTVHVLDDGEDHEGRYAGLLDDVERVRVGAREGLMGTGRAQFAEARYQRSVELVNAGRLDDALQEVRMALDLNPRHMDAIKMRERLESGRTWKSTGTMMRSFLQEMLREERGLPGRPVYGYPNLDQMLGAEPSAIPGDGNATLPPRSPAAPPARTEAARSTEPAQMELVP